MGDQPPPKRPRILPPDSNQSEQPQGHRVSAVAVEQPQGPQLNPPEVPENQLIPAPAPLTRLLPDESGSSDSELGDSKSIDHDPNDLTSVDHEPSDPPYEFDYSDLESSSDEEGDYEVEYDAMDQHEVAGDGHHENANEDGDNDFFNVIQDFLNGIGNDHPPIRRVVVGITESRVTTGFPFVNLVNSFAQFAEVRIMATEQAMKLINRDSILQVIYTEADTVTYVHILGEQLFEVLTEWATDVCVFANSALCAKLTAEEGDDLLMKTVTNFGHPISVIPVLTFREWLSPVMQDHIQTLLVRGFRVHQNVEHPVQNYAPLAHWVLHDQQGQNG